LKRIFLRPENFEDTVTSIAPEIGGQEKEDEQSQEKSIKELHRPNGADDESSLQDGEPDALPSLHHPLHRLLAHEPNGGCIPQCPIRVVWDKGKMG
jgi:hypothetical protein